MLGNALELFPTITIKEAIFLGINCAGDRVISGNDGEGFWCILPILPFNHDVVLGALVRGVGGLERAFMCHDAPELPYFSSIIILLLNVIEDLIVSQDLLILIIIDRAAELEPFRLVM